MNKSLNEDLLDSEGRRRRSWHFEKISTNITDFSTFGKRKNVQIAPIVIVTNPAIEEQKTLTSHKIVDQVSKRQTTQSPHNGNNQPYHHYVYENNEERRPSIVRRNFKKIFGK